MPPLPATFNDFLGNSSTVEHLRIAIAAGRLPHSIILSGPQGSGKYTLALMLSMAIECERQPRELWSGTSERPGQSLASFCGVCHNCVRIASRRKSRRASRASRRRPRRTPRRQTRRTHASSSSRTPTSSSSRPTRRSCSSNLARSAPSSSAPTTLPAEAPRRIFILTASSFMKEAANSLLKLLEEPPATVHLILLSRKPR